MAQINTMGIKFQDSHTSETPRETFGVSSDLLQITLFHLSLIQIHLIIPFACKVQCIFIKTLYKFTLHESFSLVEMVLALCSKLCLVLGTRYLQYQKMAGRNFVERSWGWKQHGPLCRINGEGAKYDSAPQSQSINE